MLLQFFTAIDFPDIDPIIVQLGPFALRWYSLGYILGIVLGWRYIYRLIELGYEKLSRPIIDDLVVALTFGIILGGRLGYVLFYKSGYYLENPVEIFSVWKGGMSFHGGLIGSFLATVYVAWRKKISLGELMDICCCAAPIGIGLVRVANFINQELYGRPSDVAWAVKFENVAEPRHPSQLYEAATEGLILFLILFFAVKSKTVRERPGRLSGIFLIGYGCARFGVEFFREPDEHLGFIFSGITMGQILSLPMILLGGLLLWRGLPQRSTSSAGA